MSLSQTLGSFVSNAFGVSGEIRTLDHTIMAAEVRIELTIFIPRTSGATIRHCHSAIQPKSCALPTELQIHILVVYSVISSLLGS